MELPPCSSRALYSLLEMSWWPSCHQLHPLPRMRRCLVASGTNGRWQDRGCSFILSSQNVASGGFSCGSCCVFLSCLDPPQKGQAVEVTRLWCSFVNLCDCPEDLGYPDVCNKIRKSWQQCLRALFTSAVLICNALLCIFPWFLILVCLHRGETNLLNVTFFSYFAWVAW